MRRGARLVVFLLLIFAGAAVPDARADAGLPLHASIHAGAAIDAATFAARVGHKYHVHFGRVVALDFDRDGDEDVFTSSGTIVSLWLNDGSGTLARTFRVEGRNLPLIQEQPGRHVWKDDGADADASVPTSAPSLFVPTASAHGPPLLRTSTVQRVAPAAGAGVDVDPSVPRAPPHR